MLEDCLRVLVVDDTITYRVIVKTVLSSIPGIEVVGVAPNGKIALAKIERYRPDLLTLDLQMPVMGGLEVLEHLKQSSSDVGAIVLASTSKHGASATMKALELGAFDFVAKPEGGSPEENAQVLKTDLARSIEAFARSRNVHKILHNRGASGSDKVVAASPSLALDDEIPRQVNAKFTGPADVIALGISTGGPTALHSMLPKLPGDLDAGIVIVQHMPAFFTASLAKDLNKSCRLNVSEAVDKQPIIPGHVLIAPGGKQMKVMKEAGQAFVRITDDPPENSCRPSVDCLFRSVARCYGNKAVGVIMTGMGDDGARGCKQMKQRGAAIIAQDEASCVVFGMPREAINTGMVDVVAPLDEIANEIIERVRQRAVV